MGYTNISNWLFTDLKSKPPSRPLPSTPVKTNKYIDKTDKTDKIKKTKKKKKKNRTSPGFSRKNINKKPSIVGKTINLSIKSINEID